ncbi:hypothetical protein [Maricaulis sp.]|uniref:hypothetical protein n=1 Tax=Maricaulis sp. TaxID=1486257 RepID=UPI000C3B7040|nr:hypothetical protein [Maricaulis sp.]MAC89642.1 hypothetical protein [Maricaulis sp.]
MIKPFLSAVLAFPGTAGTTFSIGMAAGAAALYFAPILGMQATVDRLRPRAENTDAVVEVVGEAESLRADENNQCIDAITEERRYWKGVIADMEAAQERRATLLPTEINHDQDHCPVRRLLPAGELLGIPGEVRAADPGPEGN